MQSINRDIKIGVFGYNFIHKKTQDILLRLFLEGFNIDALFAADRVDLNVAAPQVRTKIRHTALIHPSMICRQIQCSFQNLAHNSEELINYIEKNELDLGIIAGARILKQPVIRAFKSGIINLHPGLIPEVRGLDALLWAVYQDKPLGVTAHLIDETIDGGKILVRQPILIYQDDTMIDLSERLYDTQLDILVEAIKKAILGQFVEADISVSPNKKMPGELEKEVLMMLPDYIRKHTVSVSY